MDDQPDPNNPSKSRPGGSYALVNGLNLYYEIHGAGRPLVLLHGGLMTLEAFGPLLPALAATRQVIAVELEGHGRTLDLDRPLSAEQMAEDIAALLDRLGLPPVDLFGYSLGGMVGLRLAMRHAARLRRLVVVSAPYSNAGYYPAMVDGWPGMTVQAFAGSPVEQAYLRTAPHPERWPLVIDKARRSLMGFPGWPAAEIRAIQTPTLLILGDSDIVRPEYAVEMFRLLSGSRASGGAVSRPQTQLAVLPGVTHFDILSRLDLLLPVVLPFLDGPPDGAGTAGG